MEGHGSPVQSLRAAAYSLLNDYDAFGDSSAVSRCLEMRSRWMRQCLTLLPPERDLCLAEALPSRSRNSCEHHVCISSVCSLLEITIKPTITVFHVSTRCDLRTSLRVVRPHTSYALLMVVHSMVIHVRMRNTTTQSYHALGVPLACARRSFRLSVNTHVGQAVPGECHTVVPRKPKLNHAFCAASCTSDGTPARVILSSLSIPVLAMHRDQPAASVSGSAAITMRKARMDDACGCEQHTRVLLTPHHARRILSSARCMVHALHR